MLLLRYWRIKFAKNYRFSVFFRYLEIYRDKMSIYLVFIPYMMIASITLCYSAYFETKYSSLGGVYTEQELPEKK